MEMQRESKSEGDEETGGRHNIGTLRGAVAGAVATIVVGLAIFGAATLAGRSVGFARAQTPDGMGQMMGSMSGGGSGGDMQSMMGNGQGMANMDQMVQLCTQHMQEMSAMMQSKQAQPGATPGP